MGIVQPFINTIRPGPFPSGRQGGGAVETSGGRSSPHKSEASELAQHVSGADAFKTLTCKNNNAPMADKYRLLRCVRDGPPVAVAPHPFHPLPPILGMKSEDTRRD